jgi:hypothetical protein
LPELPLGTQTPVLFPKVEQTRLKVVTNLCQQARHINGVCGIQSHRLHLTLIIKRLVLPAAGRHRTVFDGDGMNVVTQVQNIFSCKGVTMPLGYSAPPHSWPMVEKPAQPQPWCS